MSLEPASVHAKWHVNSSNGLSRVHECDRRQTDDRPRYGETDSYRIACARAISPNIIYQFIKLESQTYIIASPVIGTSYILIIIIDHLSIAARLLYLVSKFVFLHATAHSAKRVLAIVIPSVRPSVLVSVTTREIETPGFHRMIA